jgi:hypothetical protein
MASRLSQPTSAPECQTRCCSSGSTIYRTGEPCALCSNAKRLRLPAQGWPLRLLWEKRSETYETVSLEDDFAGPVGLFPGRSSRDRCLGPEHGRRIQNRIYDDQ